MTTVEIGESRGLRWGAWAGIAFVVLFVVGVFLINTPDTDAPVDEWQEHFEDSGERVGLIIHGYAWALAGIAFAVFVSGLRERLRAVGNWLGTLALASGGVFVATLFVAGAATTAVAGGIEFGDLPEAGAGEFGRFLEQLGFATLLLFGMFAAGTFIAATSAATHRAGLIPAWLANSGYVSAVIVALGGVVFFPMVLLVLWVLVLCIVLPTRVPSEPGGHVVAQQPLDTDPTEGVI
jgi:hypothetical protein